jgi:hypothetical protein
MRRTAPITPLALSLLLLAPGRAAAQDDDPDPYENIFTSERWCDDSGTACWRSPRETPWFNGVRFIAEFDLRFVFQRGRNRFDVAGLQGLPKLAVEMNIYKSWAAVQLAITGPGQVSLDAGSLRSRITPDPGGEVKTDMGYTLAFSFLDSSIAVGVGRLNYDVRTSLPSCGREEEAAHREREGLRRRTLRERRSAIRTDHRVAALDSLTMLAREYDRARLDEQMTRPCLLATERGDSFGFIALQPVSTLRANLKKPRRDEQP